MKNLNAVFGLLLFSLLFLTTSLVGASSVPVVSISPTATDVAWGTSSVDLNVTASPEANVSSITVGYTNSYDGSSSTIGIGVNTPTSILTISTAGMPSGTVFNITLDSVTADDVNQSVDGIGTGTATITITNQPPIANDKTYKVCPGDGSLAGNIITDTPTDTDPDGNPISLADDNSTADINIADDGSFTYAPPAGFYGDYSFDYNITDGDLNSSSATVTINVKQTPTVVDDDYIIAMNGILTKNVLKNDSNTSNYDISFGVPSNGTLTNTNGSFTYTPDPDYIGLEIFDYNITDTDCGTIATATVEIQVVNVCGGIEMVLDPCYSDTIVLPKNSSVAYYFILDSEAVVDINITNTGTSELTYDFNKTSCEGVFDGDTTSDLPQGDKIDVIQTYQAGIYFFGFAGTHNATTIDVSICYDTNLSSIINSSLSANIGINDAGYSYDSFPEIRTKLVNKNFGLRASFLDKNNNVAVHVTEGSDAPIAVSLSLVDGGGNIVVPSSNLYLEIAANTPFVEMPVVNNNYVNVQNIPYMIDYAAKIRKYKISGFNNAAFEIKYPNLKCKWSSLSSSMCGLPACFNTEEVIREVFPPAFYPHVLTCLYGDGGGGSAPCDSNAYNGNCAGNKKPITPGEYNNYMGCFQCLRDAFGPSPSSDPFAIRPKTFSLEIDNVVGPNNTGDILYKAGVNYPIDLNATTWDSSITQSPNYNTTLEGYHPPEVLAVIGLVHNASLVCPDDDNHSQIIHFANGYSDSNISYSNVGKTKLVIMDQDWTEVDQVGIDTDHYECIFDSNETNTSLDPLGLGRVGCMIKAEKSMTFIPDHFSIEANLTDHNTDDHFTYLHDFNRSAFEAGGWSKSDYESTMAAIFDANISARGYSSTGDGNITSNYIEKCYAKDTILIINVNETNITYADPLTPQALTQILYYNDINESEGNISLQTQNNGIITLTQLEFKNDTIPLFLPNAPDGNGTVHLHYRIDFDRKMNRPVNPFMLEMIDANITDTDIVTGKEEDDSNATFYYARTKSSKYFYDDEPGPDAYTPISVVIYNDPSTSLFPLDLMTQFKQTNEYDWYLSTVHNFGNNDGNVTLEVTYSSPGPLTAAEVIPAADSSVDLTGGSNPNVIVRSKISTRPHDVNISFESDGNLADTNSWMIYNEYNNSIPDPFYRVRFIGISDWAGHGDTGNVVNSDADTKTNRRLGW